MAKNNQNTELTQAENKIKPVKKSRYILQWIVFIAVAMFGCYAFLLYQTQQGIQQKHLKSADDLLKSYDERIAQLASRVTLLESQLTSLKTDYRDMAQFNVFKESIEEKIASVEENLAKNIKVWAETNPKQPIRFIGKETKMQRELLLAMGTMVIRDLAERELPFAYEAEVLRIIAQGNESAEKYVDVIQKYASSGIKGKKMLISEFNDLYPHLSSKEQPIENEPVKIKKEEELPWWQDLGRTILQWTKNLFSSKKAQELPVLKPETDKVYELVNEGDLAAALNELNTDDAYTKLMNDSLRQWTYQIRLYLDFEKAVNGLLMNALANLHIKEMEH